MNDLFGPGSEKATAKPPAKPASRPAKADADGRLPLPVRDDSDYSAKDIEVLEGLEPVRRRPGMYIGGTDEAALHHLAAEILDNSMDEAVAGHASFIEVTMEEGNWLTVRDNGRGIPVDPHPKFKNMSALEVILTTLHSGGKFGGKAYATSGGLHGVGSSVVNALSETMEVEVARDRMLWKQSYARGKPLTKLINAGPVHNRRGTTHPLQARSRDLRHPCVRPQPAVPAVPVEGLPVPRRRNPLDLRAGAAERRQGRNVPAEAVLHFPGGLRDSLADDIGELGKVLPQIWAGEAALPGEATGKVEWAVVWLEQGDGFLHSYCNTVPTAQGGTHEAGFRAALVKGLRAWGEHRGNKRAAQITADDVLDPVAAKLSLFLRDPQFQGQTKEKLTSAEAARLVETALRDRFDHFLAGDPASADNLLAFVIERAEDRIRRKENKDTARKSPTRRLRLPGKLTDCTRENAAETEIFLVEGDSAGGSAKQARNRETQAVLPLRGKILNVASASADKLRQNQELKDLIEALGCGVGDRFDRAKLRYGRVIIMTDADVDGAHIASLLMTFFYKELPELVRHGHIYLAQPPLYRLTQGAKSIYAMDDKDREQKMRRAFKAGTKVEVSRFKGLGEMPPAQLKETTMDPAKRTLLKVMAIPEQRAATNDLVESLMGRRPELRFAFIQERAKTVEEVDV